MKFSYEYLLYDHDTDVNGIMSVASIMRYAQQTASLQHVAYGPQIPDLRRQGKAFILSRVALDVISTPPRSCTPFTVTTWLNQARGYAFNRYTELSCDGSTFARMSATWGIMDIEARHPLKVEQTPVGFEADEDILTLNAPLRFRIEKEAVFEKVGTHKVVYGDCDENLHVNNCNYPTLFLSCLNGMVGKRVSQLSVSFMKEARLNSSFDILLSRYGGAYIFRTTLESGEHGTEARIVTEDI